jgi:Tfp pilus assembly protein PilO
MNQNHRLYFSIIVSISILVFSLLVLPAFDKTRTLSGSIKERENMLDELQQTAGRIAEFNNEIKTNEANIAKLDQLLPRQKEVSEILVTIESIISSSGLYLSELSISEPVSQGIGKVNANIKLTGEFYSLMNFLDLLEKNLRLIEINAIDISTQPGGGLSAINYDIKFEASYLLPESEL